MSTCWSVERQAVMITAMQASSGRHEDLECQSNAGQYLGMLIGSAPDDLRWDSTHHLQGHARCAGREIIVIAARDDLHHAIVLTLEDWQSIRVAEGSERVQMLRACAIESHARLLEALDS